MNISEYNLNELEDYTIKELKYIITELGGQPYRYRLKEDLIYYINILIKKIITNFGYIKSSIISNIISDGTIKKIKNIYETKIKLLEKEGENRTLIKKISILEDDNKYLIKRLKYLNNKNITLVNNYNKLSQSKSLCVTHELSELSSIILDKSSSNEIPEGTALELNNKLLEIYKKSKYDSIETYDINALIDDY